MSTSPAPTSPTSTYAATPGATPTAAEYSGADAVWVVDVMNHTRADAEELIRAKGPQVNIVATGDTDPQYARDELVCEQTPTAGKIAPTGTITLKFCNTYRKPSEAPELRGMAIEDAKKKAASAGFTGTFEIIEMSDFDKDCKANTVCRVSPDRWDWNQDHTLTLYINRKLTISTPD